MTACQLQSKDCLYNSSQKSFITLYYMTQICSKEKKKKELCFKGTVPQVGYSLILISLPFGTASRSHVLWKWRSPPLDQKDGHLKRELLEFPSGSAVGT